jgi:hypothetical protein
MIDDGWRDSPVIDNKRSFPILNNLAFQLPQAIIVTSHPKPKRKTSSSAYSVYCGGLFGRGQWSFVCLFNKL